MSQAFRSAPALVLIDVQKGFLEREARGDRRNNAQAVPNMARLLAAFRETTTRMAGNLGFDAHLVSDACFAFDRTGFGGRKESAEDIHAMTLSNLDGEFATIETTDTVLAALPQPAAS